MKRKLWILLLMMLPFALFSQTDSEKRMRIGEVQQNYELYFRGDATEETAEKAMEKALKALKREIDVYADTAKGVTVSYTAVTEKINKVEMTRGDRFRAFVFVKKEDVVISMEAKPSDLPMASPLQVYAPPAAAETVTAAAETPVPEPQKQENVLEEIKRVKTLSELRPLLVRRKEAGEVLDYNRYSALNDATMYYVVIFSREGNVMALLSPGREQRVNLMTGEEENMSKYKGYGAIAVLLSKNH